MAGVHRLTLSSLQPEIKNSLIIGIIISKQEVKIFQAKNTSFSTGERGVWNFTLRDSVIDFANVTVWGSKEYIEGLYANFRIGQVVELVNPKISLRQGNDRGEMFVPSVSSQFNITLNQGTSDMHIHNSPDRAKYVSLLTLPTKNLNQIQPLDAVMKNIEQMKNEHVDIMVVLMSMTPMRQLTTKDGRDTVCRDIDVNDGSIEASVNLRIWGIDWVERAEFWQTRHTVLLLADVLITFNTFKKKMALTIGRKTLITENPNVSQAQIVRAAIRHLPEQPLISGTSETNPSSVTNLMTVRQICEKVEHNESNVEQVLFTALIHVVINQMNFEHKSVVSTKCALCKKWVQPDKESCLNPNCACGNGTRTPENVSHFNFKLNVSDHTGHLVGCRLIGVAAEDFLKCTVQDFKGMSLKERDELKWHCLLEKCSIVLQVVGPTASWPSPVYNVLSVKRLEENMRPGENASTSGLYS
ncbi:meiosis-specific with OB domain-containing protein [Neodiprion pinetum]|uniref:meiosis-specific with OB domain-containing protein n=1 Tax=Neodiprion pinetum TaxID=441929 RepID=UPI001EDF06B2|nr:meiosis-specific with OB domain-containing protein [Neodiprion pinetum]